MVRILIAALLFMTGVLGEASSCCGQSPASFTILSLEQRLSLSTSYSVIQTAGRMMPLRGNDQFFLFEDRSREVQALNLNVASGFATRQQVFVTTSLMRGLYQDDVGRETSQSLSDTLVGYSYEALPEYRFSYWKPVVYLSVLANLPTGRSIYDTSSLTEGAGVTGHNQWGAGLGVTLKKVYFPLTLTLQMKTLQLFPETIERTKVSGFFDSSVAFLVNYASPFWNVALNGGITFNHLSPRTIESSRTSSLEMQNTSVLVGLQRPITESWGAGITYTDQTLVGEARNTLLNRTYTMNLNYTYF